MIYGAWIHNKVMPSFEENIKLASSVGIKSYRSYSLASTLNVLQYLKMGNLSVHAGYYVYPEHLLTDWKSQFRPKILNYYSNISIPVVGICIGNELRDGGDDPNKKHFSPLLAKNLSSLLRESRKWLNDHGYNTPVTYAMEGISFDQDTFDFLDWSWEVAEACDIVSINLYPMGIDEWHSDKSFELNKSFLLDDKEFESRIKVFEFQLRKILEQLKKINKKMILSETGFPSATNYTLKDNLFIPDHDNSAYAERMFYFVNLINKMSSEFDNIIQTTYFYEWQDNLYHSKITNIENSPIHTSFGLCDHEGNQKLDIKKLLQIGAAN